MKYIDLIEFCHVITATQADVDQMGDRHVHPSGYVEAVLAKVLQAIRDEVDFDWRSYLEQLVGFDADTSQTNEKKKWLN